MINISSRILQKYWSNDMLQAVKISAPQTPTPQPRLKIPRKSPQNDLQFDNDRQGFPGIANLQIGGFKCK
jgi:hypothetical protein